MLVPVGLSEAQVATPDGSNLDAFILPVSPNSQSDDIVMLNVTAYGNINPLTFSWSQTYNGSPIVRLQNADSSLTSFRIPYATSGQDATLSFEARVNDGPYHITRTIDVPVTLVVKPPIVVLPREPTPGVAETILFEQQWGDTDGWTLDGQWSIASSTDILPVDTNNRVINIGECNGSCPLQLTDGVELFSHDGADLVFWVWFGDQIASTDSLNIEVAMAQDGTWENKHAITVGQSTHQRWFPVTVNLDEFAGDDFFLRFTPSLDSDKGTIQIDAVQLIAKTNDDVRPILSNIPQDIIRDTLGPSVVTFVKPTAIDNVDGPVAVECDAPSGIIYPFDTVTVTCKSEDSAGNTASASFDVTLNRFIPLEITAPDDQILEAIGELTPVNLGNAIITKAATITNDAPDLFPLGNTTVTWTAQDDRDTANDTQIITVQDTTDPVITPPGNVMHEATSILSMIKLGVATATDTVDPMPTITSDAPNSFPIGTTRITYTATDDSGNSATATQEITINDAEPMLILPSDVIAEATGVLTRVDIGTANVTDNIDSLTATNNATDSFPLGVTIVAWTAKDSSGNTVTAVQKITVQDTTNPYFDAPESYNVFAEATGIFTSVEINTVTVHDIADPDVTVTNDAPDSFPTGATFVTWTARDSSGNTAQYNQVVVVSDRTSPTITAPDDVTIEADGLLTMIQLGVATATDLVDTAPRITSDAPTSFPIGVTIITYTAADDAGNSATDTQKVTVRDTTEPMLILPLDVTAEATGVLTILDIGTARVTDNVDSLTATNDAPDSFQVGETRVTWTAKDNADNEVTAVQTVIIRDTTKPVITVPDSIIAEATDRLTPVDIGSATASDIADPDVTITNNSPGSFPLGSTVIEWSATDDSDNVTNDTQTVRIQDTTNPVFTSFPEDITVTFLNRGTVEFETPVATDIFAATVLCDYDSGDSFPIGSTLVTCVATDANDNSARNSFSVIVMPPVVPPVADPISNLNAVLVTLDSLELQWTQPELNGGTFKNYLVNFTTSHGTTMTFLANTTANSYTHIGLTPGTEYSYSVKTVTVEGGASEPSNILNLRTLPLPEPIDDLTASEITANSLVLSWTQPELNNGTLSTYRILSALSPETPTIILANTTNTSYTISDLMPYTAYSFSVTTATNEGGTSESSNVLDIITLPARPEPVLDLSVTDITSDSLRLEWTQPELNNGTLQTYRLVMTSPHGDPKTFVGLTAEPFFEVTGLTLGTDYSFRVQARTDGGFSGGNAILDTATLTLPPEPISNLNAVLVEPTLLELQWTQPELNGGTFKNYLVNFTTSHGTTMTFLANTTTNSYTHTGLTPDTEYSYSVKTVTVEGGASEPSNILNLKTMSLPEPITNLTATDITTNSLVLSWTQPELNNGTLSTYRILSALSPETPTIILANTTNTSYTISDLIPYTAYSFSVITTTNEGGTSESSNILDTTTLPVRPEPINDLTVSNITSNSLRLDWTQPDLNGGTLIRYDILRNPPAPAFASTNNTLYTVTGLDPNTSSAYAIRTITDMGQSQISNIVNVTTSPILPPDPIDDLTAIEITVNSTRLEWTQPDLHGGTLQEYQLFITTPYENFTSSLPLTTEPSHLLHLLYPGAQYSLSVKTLNEAGYGDQSNIVDIKLLTPPDPEPVDDLSIRDITHNSASLDWGNPISYGYFKHTYSIIEIPEAIIPLTTFLTNLRSTTIDNLEPETEYTYRIDTEYRDFIIQGIPVTFTTLPEPIDDLVATDITTDSLTLSWTQPVFNDSTLQTYHILSASPHGTPTTILANTTNTSYAVSDLMLNTAYSFSVRTVTNQGVTSESSNIIDTRTLSARPEPINDLTVSNITSSSLRLEWTQPDLNGGTFQEYRLLSTSPHGDLLTQLALTTEPFFEVTGLTPDIDYSFQVHVRTDGGFSGGDVILNTRTLPLPPPPDAIDDLIATDITYTSLRLEWTQPDLNGGTFQGYQLSGTSSPENYTYQLPLTSEPSHFIYGMYPDTQYSFSLKTSNEAGYGDQSNIVNIKTLKPPDPEPVDDLLIRDITHNSASLDWGSPISYGYATHLYSIIEIPEEIMRVKLSSNLFSSTINNLEPGTEYTYRIDAEYRNFIIQGVPVTFTTLPEPIDDLTASAITTDSLTLSWTQPVFNDSTLQTYHILSASPHGTPTTILANTTNTSYTISDLMLNTEYSFSVRTVINQGTTSESSNIIDAKTLPVYPFLNTTKPVFISFPDDIITTTSKNNISVEFESPTARGFSSVTIMCSHDSGDSFSVGNTLVTCTATDTHDNFIQDSFIVTVVPYPGFATITDDFSNLGPWQYSKPTDWGPGPTFRNYTVTISTTDGNPAPSALISGDGYGSSGPAFFRSFSLQNHAPDDPLYLSFDYRAQSLSSDITNADLIIWNDSYTGLVLFDRLVRGGTLDTGWRTYSTDISENVSGQDSIDIRLILTDDWLADYHQRLSVDNFYLGVDPPPSRSISGEADIQLTPLQELSLQISQYDQTQICGFIESLDESSDTYADTLKLIRLYNMTTTC